MCISHDGGTYFTGREAESKISTAMKKTDKKSLKAVVAEFRRRVVRHRAQRSSEESIRQILGEAIWLAFQEIEDPALRAWISDEFTKAAGLAPIVTNCPVSLTRH